MKICARGRKAAGLFVGFTVSSIYNALDSFLAVETWHTGHPSDEKRFYLALNEIVGHPDFSSESMGTFLRERVKIASADRDQYFENAIQALVTKAWAVRDFLQYTGRLAEPTG